MATLENVLEGNTESCVSPFLWVHGEDEKAYDREIQAIYDSGIRQLCIEARPHPDFNGPGWFHDVGFIIDACKRRGMGVWLLDDSHFPTGYANGEVKRSHPELQKRYLSLATFDVMGPQKGSQLNLRYVLGNPEDQLVAVLAQRRREDDTPDVSQTIELTPYVHERDDYLTGTPVYDPLGNKTDGTYGRCVVCDLKLPEGQWYVQVLRVSYSGGERETEGYLNPIDPAATKVLLDTVYEPIYQHFGEHFGKTFKGFFSDEPRFGNIHGAERSSIGRNPQMPLPWSDDVAPALLARLQKTELSVSSEQDLVRLLPLLFVGDDTSAHVVRYAYMDVISELYSKNFDGVIAAWCHEHDVCHIGHTIEDDNAVARLGYGPGHFFRAMRHQDMAGIDVVMEQLVPGYDSGLFRAFHKPGWDAEFFTYMLGKLGGSLAHLDREKRGQCMCEVFGAYGWPEGNRLAKWIVDYMLVRGVNFFVPHAFSPKEFPDSDCPPHFFAQGRNPQYPEFSQLMGYTSRMATLLSGGSYQPPVALWFNAEAEWSGSWQLAQKPARELSRAQIEYDLVPSDYLGRARVVSEGGRVLLEAGAERFSTVVMPCSEAVPQAVLEALSRALDGGISVWFVDALPKRTCEGAEGSAALASVASRAHVVPLSSLAKELADAGFRELAPSSPQPFLRTYHYRLDGRDEYLFVNEHPSRRVRCALSGAPDGPAVAYDAFENRLIDDGHPFELDLPPYGSKLVVVGEDLPCATRVEHAEPAETIELSRCTLSLASFENLSSWSEPVALDGPCDVTALPGHEGFAGRARYEFSLSLSKEQAARCREHGATLSLEGVREAAHVWANGQDVGSKIVGDYAFEVGAALHDGDNALCVEVNSTLGRAMDDFIGQFLPLEGVGLSSAKLSIN